MRLKKKKIKNKVNLLRSKRKKRKFKRSPFINNHLISFKPLEITYLAKGGVFKIINSVSQQVFFGAGGNLLRRIGDFFYLTKDKTDYPWELREEYEKNGFKNLSFILLESNLPDDWATLIQIRYAYMAQAQKEGVQFYNKITQREQTSIDVAGKQNLFLQNKNQNLNFLFTSGLYEIRKEIQTEKGIETKSYIGQFEKNFFQRITDHFNKFWTKTHYYQAFQNDWLLNSSSFRFFLLNYGSNFADSVTWLKYERAYIWMFYPNVYNDLPTDKRAKPKKWARKNITRSIYWEGTRYETIEDCVRETEKTQKQIKILAYDIINNNVLFGTSSGRHNYTKKTWLIVFKDTYQIFLNSYLAALSLGYKSSASVENGMKDNPNWVYFDQLDPKELKIFPDLKRKLIIEMRKTLYLPLDPDVPIELEILNSQSETHPDSCDDNEFWQIYAKNKEKVIKSNYQKMINQVNETLQKVDKNYKKLTMKSLKKSDFGKNV